MRISDWSSDVCSSDLHHRCRQAEFRAAQCPRKQSSMVKKLTRTVLSAADVGVPVLLLSLLAASVHAFTAPVAGDLGYDIYDIVVNQGVKGPPGFVGGVAAFLFGVSRLFSNIMIGIPPIVAAVCLIKADSILQTLDRKSTRLNSSQ